MAASMGDTNILPSPMRPVRAAFADGFNRKVYSIVSRIISTFTLDRNSTVLSVPL